MAGTDTIINNTGRTHIVRVTNGNYRQFKHIKYLQIGIEDDAKEANKLSAYFKSAQEFIDEALETKTNRVLVHCNAGVSRSASIVIAYLMQSKQMSLCDAWM